MRTRLAICGAIAVAASRVGAADAPGPADFDARFALVNVVEGLNAVALPELVYRAVSSRGLDDLRIFNDRGEALPLARLPAAPAPVPELRTTALTLVALPARTDARDAALQAYALRFERDRQRAVIEIKGAAEARATADDAIGGYLIDARPLKDRQGRLRVAFAPHAPDFAARAEILGSDDLVHWRVLAHGALARERRLGQAIENGHFEIRRPPPFLRIAWSGAVAPQIATAQFDEPLPAVSALPRATLATHTAEDGRRLFVDVPPALPIERLYVRMPQANRSERVSVYRHVADPAPRARRLGLVPRRAPEQWVAVGALEVFRVTRDGVEVEGPPLVLDAPTDRLRIDAERAFGDALPVVEAEWRPARVAFVARAPGPYLVAAGHAKAQPSPSLDLATLLPADDPAGLRLPVAKVEAGTVGAGSEAAMAAARAGRIAAQAHWSRALLWAVLGAAVVALGWMALRLAKQLRAASPADADAPR